VNLQHCSVGTFGEVVDHIVYLLRKCQNLGASNRTPVQTIGKDNTLWTIRCVRKEKESCDERQMKVTLLLSLPSFLLVIVGYNKSIVLQQDMIVLKYYIPPIVAMYRDIHMHSTTTRL
jgi:hypothetical protein